MTPVLIGAAIGLALVLIYHFREPIGRFFTDTLPRVVGAGLEGLGRLVFQTIPNAIGRAFSAAGGVVGRFLTETVPRAAAAIPGLILGALRDVGGMLVRVGGAIVRGLWEGIRGSADWFRDRFLGFLRAILPGPVERFLGISSPSRMFANYGLNIMQGLAQGITAGAAAPELALQAAVRRLQPGAVPAWAVAAGGRGGGAPSVAGSVRDAADTIRVTVINPAPEPAGTSVIREIGKARWLRGGR